MRRVALLGLAVAACGRIGFAPDQRTDDATTSGGDAADAPDGPRATDHLTCGVATELLSNASLVLDQARVISDRTGDYLLINHHVSANDHPIRSVALGSDGTNLTVGAEQNLIESQDGLFYAVPIANGNLVVVSDQSAALTTTSYRVIDGAVDGQGMGVFPLRGAMRPVARDGDGVIAVIGAIGTEDVVVVPVAPDGDIDINTRTTVEIGAQQPRDMVIAELRAGFVAAWGIGATNGCRIARLDANLTIVAGPVDVTLSHPCQLPYVARLGPDRIVLAASDAATESLSHVVFDLDLAVVVGAQSIAGEWANLLAMDDHTWMSWSGGNEELRTGWIDQAGNLTVQDSLGGLTVVAPWSHGLSLVGTVPIVVWDDAPTGMIKTTRLCQ